MPGLIAAGMMVSSVAAQSGQFDATEDAIRSRLLNRHKVLVGQKFNGNLDMYGSLVGLEQNFAGCSSTSILCGNTLVNTGNSSADVAYVDGGLSL